MGTDVHAVAQAKIKGEWKDVPMKWGQDRHYFLFAWLANVRNGFGFAGVPTHEPITPLSEPRGFPADFTLQNDEHPTTLEAYDPGRVEYLSEEERASPSFWMGDHSHSWLTADEILATPAPTLGADRKDLSYFVDEVKRLKDEYGEVRLVFGFDS